jgi:hypothetical protein
MLAGLRCRAAVRGAWCAIGLAVIILSSVGCSTHERVGVSAEPGVSSTPALLNSAALRLPLDAYLFSPAELRRVGEAHRVLVRRCMRRFGFDYRPGASARVGPRTANERRYGLTDERAAAVEGYALEAHRLTSANARKSTKRTEDAGALSALIGRGPRSIGGMQLPAGGGVGQPHPRLARSSTSDRDLAQRLSLDTYDRSQRDARVRAVIRRWSDCMTTRGFSYAGPLDPPGDPRFSKGLPPQEIETAKADVACKKQTNLIGIWFAVESAYQNREITQHRELLRKIQQANAVQLRRATVVAASGR